MPYDNLIKRLWECASGECFNCSQYTETTNASVCSKELMKQAADAIEELSKPKWIPVTERVPEVDQPVMICAFGKSVGEGVYRGHDGFHHVWKMYTSSGTYWDDEVTHWMPLPEPPEEVTQDD